ncbi:Multidrug resistance protein D [Kluyvera cryocrescens]|uniref:Multidrug resistance protein D n=1 Tax=Kluyvera cryocrescens TaxID=580 RepID=A0A485B3Q3_KLUCR|nr:Multidrug resistance protein D [Kluyvera cryocrescens]
MVKSSSRYGRFLSLSAHYLDIYSYKPNFYKVISEMKRDRNVNILVMLVLLVAVGQMAQTIYIPAIAQMANDLNVREGAVQSVMAAYLLTYGVSQLFYGPLSDRVGRRPVILVGMSIFMLATLVAITTHSLTVLIAASAMQGMGTGVGGVMARTLPRDLYEGSQLRHANSLLNMGILVSPLLAPLIGGVLETLINWRACYGFLLVLCAGVTFSMAPLDAGNPADRCTQKRGLSATIKPCSATAAFNCFLLMLIGGLAGIAVFEASSGVLMGGVLGLSSMTVSILFILPIPAAFFGAWFAGRPNKRFPTMMWQSVLSCLAAGLMMWIPGLFGVMNIWDAAGARCAVLLRRWHAVSAGDQRCNGAVPVPRRYRRSTGGWPAKYRFRRAGLAVGDDAANRAGQHWPADDADGAADFPLLAAAGVAHVAAGTGCLKRRQASSVACRRYFTCSCSQPINASIFGHCRPGNVVM